MADNRYGGLGRREGWRDRHDSIFSDDDDRWDRGSSRWSSDHGRSRGGQERDRQDRDERGFFERTADEVRSWLGDEEAERRREMDARRDEARDAFGGPDRESRRYRTGGSGGSGSRGDYREERFGSGGGFGGRSDYRGQDSFGGQGDYHGQSGIGGSQSGGRSQWDENYRRWRDQQIAQFDREYEEYCHDCQQSFDQDFSSWRKSRQSGQSRSGETGQSGSSESGLIGGGTRESGKAGSRGAESEGSTASAGGEASAMESSSGSTATATGGGRGRSGRSRS